MHGRRRSLIVATVVVAAVAALAGRGAGSTDAEPLFNPTPRFDPRDARTPLDLRQVTFGQRGTTLLLRMRLWRRFSVSQLQPSRGRSLCVELYYGRLDRPRVRLCPDDRGRRVVLVREVLSSTGAATKRRVVPAIKVRRPSGGTVEAEFSPVAAGIPLGPFTWRAVSRWRGGRWCRSVRGCVDRLPDAGPATAEATLYAAPDCFGAAARDPRAPCENPALRGKVIPGVFEALTMPNARCEIVRLRGVLSQCRFGVDDRQARGTAVLIGDSHAIHWRGAVEVATQRFRWRGLTMAHAGCPFSYVSAKLSEEWETRRCRRWNRAMRRWLRRHREVSTVFLSARARTHFARGKAKPGFARMLARLPPHVRRIVILRDTPESSSARIGCLQDALARKLVAGVVCAQPRSRSLQPDRLAAAARSLRSSRISVVDLSDHMCDRSRCFPVVGGALVIKDDSHITNTFAETLGPYLVRALERSY